MKKKILTLLLIACQTLAFAEGSALLVTKKDGSKLGYLLSEKPVVSFSGTALTIKTTEVSTDIERADISTFTFVPENEVTTIKQVSKDNSVFEYRGGTFRADGATIQVYTVGGRLVKSAVGSVSLSNEPGGVYIVKANNQVIKINKE